GGGAVRLDKLEIAGFVAPGPEQIEAWRRYLDSDPLASLIAGAAGAGPKLSLPAFKLARLSGLRLEADGLAATLDEAEASSDPAAGSADFGFKGLSLPAGAWALVHPELPSWLPAGFKLSGGQNCAVAPRRLSLALRAEGTGLCGAGLSLAVVMDTGEFFKHALSGNVFRLQRLLDKHAWLEKASLSYVDRGAAAVAVGKLAAESGVTPAQAAASLAGQAGRWAEGQPAALAPLGRIAREQLERPGRVTAEIAPAEPIRLGKLFKALARSPETLPWQFDSRPGDKPLLPAGP
ncbi:MAG: hypothetical protein HUK26_05015, partial [Duodenibacillus sp.]|nr:hypothetical protein [Duodenibacillus sp.]